MDLLARIGDNAWRIQEMEISITSRCTLACAECGFLVPHQPEPTIGEPVAELSNGLAKLNHLGIRVGSLAILGGEPTMFASLLERAVRSIRDIGIAERLEIVSNGLTPQGLTAATMAAIDQVTISVYTRTDELIALWQDWLAEAAPDVVLRVRRNERGWDQWTGDLRVSDDEAQAMFERCWYRKHCITLERGRLFACSRIAKLSDDANGLPIDDRTTINDIRGYLGRESALPPCATCVPMMRLPPVRAGVQPDHRIERLEQRAQEWLRMQLRRGSQATQSHTEGG